MERKCGDCTLCCKLLPVASLDKKANVKCQFQKFHVGCTVYHKKGFPIECGAWTCKWLINDDTEKLARPDRSHYVIDHVPDIVTVVDHDNNDTERQMEAVIVWIDPNYPDAHRDPQLRAYIERRAAEDKITMVRYNSYDSLTIVAPSLTKEHRWFEIPGTATTHNKFSDFVAKAVRHEYLKQNREK